MHVDMIVLRFRFWPYLLVFNETHLFVLTKLNVYKFTMFVKALSLNYTIFYI